MFGLEFHVEKDKYYQNPSPSRNKITIPHAEFFNFMREIEKQKINIRFAFPDAECRDTDSDITMCQRIWKTYSTKDKHLFLESKVEEVVGASDLPLLKKVEFDLFLKANTVRFTQLFLKVFNEGGTLKIDKNPEEIEAGFLKHAGTASGEPYFESQAFRLQKQLIALPLIIQDEGLKRGLYELKTTVDELNPAIYPKLGQSIRTKLLEFINDNFTFDNRVIGYAGWLKNNSLIHQLLPIEQWDNWKMNCASLGTRMSKMSLVDFHTKIHEGKRKISIAPGYKGQTKICNFCKRPGHTEIECRTKRRKIDPERQPSSKVRIAE